LPRFANANALAKQISAAIFLLFHFEYWGRLYKKVIENIDPLKTSILNPPS
jgi:hypothetical protein